MFELKLNLNLIKSGFSYTLMFCLKKKKKKKSGWEETFSPPCIILIISVATYTA